MSPSTVIPPRFLLNIRRDSGERPYLLSCGMVGETGGFSSLVRRFAKKEELIADFCSAGIARDRYESLVSSADDGQTRSFEIDLNEGQKLSIILTDTTE
jgi:hypothetical protein